MTQVKDLKEGLRKVNIVAVISDKQAVRDIEVQGRQRRVCDCTAKDGTGSVKMSVWDAECDKVNVGDTVRITNGYVSVFNDELVLSAGKFGKFEVIGGDEQQKV